jgi:hypothetical protein
MFKICAATGMLFVCFSGISQTDTSIVHSTTEDVNLKFQEEIGKAGCDESVKPARKEVRAPIHRSFTFQLIPTKKAP